MQSPIREHIRLDGRWQSRPVDARTASVFVPGPWANKQVYLQSTPAAGGQVSVKELALEPGQWNTVRTTGGEAAGARLVAAHPMHITSLEAHAANRRSLAVRVQLSAPEGATVQGLLTIVLSLTATSGQLVGGTEVTVGAKTRDLTVEVALPGLRGIYRLKAALCAGDRVIDNARIDVHL